MPATIAKMKIADPLSSMKAGAVDDVPFDSSPPDEQLENSSTLPNITTLGSKSLKMFSGSCYLPHPDKEATGGEDAHFICTDKQAIGVADGVGSWADLGINAGLFAQELMSNSVRAVQEEPKGSFNPVKVLEKAHSNTKAEGSSTACIIALTDEALNAINFGDSGFIVIRDGHTIFKSPVQQQAFDFPYQLESGNGGDLPSSGEVFTIPVAQGDVIVAGTDGLFDNLYTNDITAVVVQAVRAGQAPQVTAQKIAALARQRAMDKNRQSPYSTAAQEAGFQYYGGKLDDITVVVSYITSSSSVRRKAPPSHYTFKIQSFSLLSEASIEKCVSEVFEAGGYKWSLSIYPTGNAKEDGRGHVSMYLVLMDSSSLPVDWEVNAIVNFSAYNFRGDEYVTTQDTTVRRFHVMKTKWGVPKFIDLETFKDPSNGYLVDDTCLFGAEVFVVKTINKGDCLSIHRPVTISHSWKFNKFSFANLEKYESESFVGGDYKWKLLLYPKGIVEGKGNSISLFLTLEVSTLPPNTKVVVDCTLRAKNQITGNHAQLKFSRIRKFSSSNSAWGSRNLVSLAKLKDPKSGFLVDDTCIFEAEFTIIGLITPRNTD